MSFNYSKTTRSEKGSLVTLAVACFLIFFVGIGAFAIDLSHNVSVRTAMQNATDAGAISGAEDYKSPATYNLADSDALTVAAQNSADGREISNVSPNTTVTVNTQQPNGGEPGICTVTATMQIQNMFAKLFGHSTDQITVTSTADYWTQVTSIEPNQMFPIAPSLDDTSHGIALNSHKIGDSYTIWLEPNGGNAAWTAGTYNLHNPSTPVIQAAADAALHLTTPPPPGADPQVWVGDGHQVALTQGLHNGVDLSQAPYPDAMMNAPYIVMPVITGSNPYNQDRTIYGFVAMKITSVGTSAGSLYVTGNIVNATVKGIGGTLPDPRLNQSSNLGNLSVGTVKLVQ